LIGNIQKTISADPITQVLSLCINIGKTCKKAESEL